jgi:SAM-dependent methyltransferase
VSRRLSQVGTDGSQEYFKQFWSGAGEQDYAYPRAIPRTQWDLFEREKVLLVQRFLAESEAPGTLALEYGCGSAGMSVYLANQGFRAVATDISVEALQVARANWEQNAAEAVQTLFTAALVDAFHLPFRDSAFDNVMSYGLLEHFDRGALAGSLAETRRVLRPGGVFLGDSVHGRFSARKVATWLNFGASWIYHALRGRFRELASLPGAYFHPFYENDLGLADWRECLSSAGFVQVQVLCTRPFPPLAIAGRLERLYVSLMEKAVRFYRWFDESQSWLSRRWGWTYLFRAVKPDE